MKEEWRDIEGYEGLYQVSNLGAVRKLPQFKNGRGYHKVSEILIRKSVKHKSGYLQVNLSKDGVQSNKKVHRLVATVFLSNETMKPEVNHINGDRADNRLENLEWCTPTENMKHAYRTGLKSNKGGKNSRAKITEEDVRWIRSNPHLRANVIAEFLEQPRHIIDDLRSGRTWRHII